MSNYFKQFFGLIIFTLVLLSAKGQKLILFDSSELTTKTELNLLNTTKRGIEDETKTLFYVEKDLQTLSAYQNGLLKWKINIIKTFGAAKVGRQEIRYIKLENDQLIVTYGKHTFAKVNIHTGKGIFLGSD